MVRMYRCGYNNYPTPLVLAFLGQQHPYFFVHFKNVCLFFCMYIHCIFKFLIMQ